MRQILQQRGHTKNIDIVETGAGTGMMIGVTRIGIETGNPKGTAGASLPGRLVGGILTQILHLT